MAYQLDLLRLEAVFGSRPDLLAEIKQNADTPGRVVLFNKIAAFLSEATDQSEPALKRRKLDGPLPVGVPSGSSNGLAGASSNGLASVANEPVQLEIRDVSVSIPQRKKFDMCFTAKHLYAKAPGTSGPVQGMVYAWKDIEYVFCLPVPEKSQLQYNYILFPYGSACPPSALSAKPAANEPTAAAAPEPLVLTVAASGAAAAPKAGSVGGTLAAQAAARAGDGYTTLFDWALTAHLNAGGSPAREITRADPSRFKSAVRQPHRPNEPAVHVKAFRGSKDGYLFFLDTGLLWGFKKPLLFVPLDRVAAVSYTSVLQRTFNMIVEVYAGGAGTGAEGGEKTEEVEFAMLDQEDYSAIDQSWVRRHGLQDRSMAEQRRAKRQLAENAADGAGAAGSRAANGGGGAAAAAAAGDYGEGEAEEGDEFAGMTELEKAHAIAERQLQDAEDEEEEDYDPGSEGYSDGSGSSGEEQEDDQGEGGYEEEVGEDEDEEEREDEQ